MGDLAALLVMEGPAVGGLGSEAGQREICKACLASPQRAAHERALGLGFSSSSPWGTTAGEKAAAEQTHAATTDVRIILSFQSWNGVTIDSSTRTNRKNVTNPRRLFLYIFGKSRGKTGSFFRSAGA